MSENAETYDPSRYERPSVTVDVVIFTLQNSELHVLLVQRKRWPFEGRWAIPGGFINMDETLEQAARRELEEETGLHVELDGVFDVHTTFHDRNRHNAGIWFSGHRVGGTLCAGDDAKAAAFFALDDIPTPLAFETDARVIQRLRDERR
jgi:8-oxo-dGTP diphosphatase